MARARGTRADGSNWSEKEIDAVWQIAKPIPGKNRDLYRQDAYGFQIYRYSFRKTSKQGWEIDHIRPVNLGGTDDMANLQPLVWTMNREKGTLYPWFGLTWCGPLYAEPDDNRFAGSSRGRKATRQMAGA